MNSIILRGSGGDVRHVYHRAAQLGSWTVECGRLTAQVCQSDPFRLSQTPLIFEVRRPNGAIWSWPLTGVVVSGAELTATLDDPESVGT